MKEGAPVRGSKHIERVSLERRYATVSRIGGPWIETHGYNRFSLREMGHRPPLQLALMLVLILALAPVAMGKEARDDRPFVIIAVSAPGDETYGEAFARWAKQWSQAAKSGDARQQVIGLGESKEGALADLRKALDEEQKDGASALWIALIGHGTFDGKEPKFNLAGDDLKASDLAAWLAPFQRPIVVICGFSTSGAWLKPLSGRDRVIITATKSGAEVNYSRFAGYFATAIADPAADLDKDGQTSVLEAWLSASKQVEDYYKAEGRLATEHSLLEDNGDGLGTPPTWFSGIRAVKKPKGNNQPDGARAHQLSLIPSNDERELAPELRQERDNLELELARLREQKSALPEDEYFAKLEEVLVRIARIYQGERPPSPATAPQK
jgi:hypothetical protein